MQTCGCESIHRDNRPTNLFQFGGIRFLGETVYHTKNSTYTELEPYVHVCVRCYYYNYI
jgi:hypothetical protein